MKMSMNVIEYSCIQMPEIYKEGYSAYCFQHKQGWPDNSLSFVTAGKLQIGIDGYNWNWFYGLIQTPSIHL